MLAGFFLRFALFVRVRYTIFVTVRTRARAARFLVALFRLFGAGLDFAFTGRRLRLSAAFWALVPKIRTCFGESLRFFFPALFLRGLLGLTMDRT